jgi:glycyl-tRNA synthetase beta subunit
VNCSPHRPAALEALPIAKRMRWGAGEAQFVRPVHWVTMLFGRDIVATEIMGVPTSNVTYGHRFMAPKARGSNPMSYVKTLHARPRNGRCPRTSRNDSSRVAAAANDRWRGSHRG